MKTIDDIIKAKAKQAVEDAFQEFINSVVQMKDDKPKRVQKYCRICHKLECDCLIKSMEGMVIESSKDERLREALEKVRNAYPYDVFPKNGKSIDCKCAEMARITCDNIEREYNEEAMEEYASQLKPDAKEFGKITEKNLNDAIMRIKQDKSKDERLREIIENSLYRF